MRDTKNMLIANEWQGPADDIPFVEFEWIKSIPKKIYCRLSQPWIASRKNTLPEGYDLYVVNFRLEPIDLDWVDQMSNSGKTIIILTEAYDNNYPTSDNIFVYNWIYWQKQLERAMQLHPRPPNVDQTIKWKASGICHRATLSKLIIVVALLEELQNDALIKLGLWVEDVNINHGQDTGNRVVDEILAIYRDRYRGREFAIDDFVESINNNQHFTINPWVPFLQNCALHFTNEIQFSSFLARPDKEFIYPGPLFSEKTLKCLLAGTAFVPVGQYHSYRCLESLGLRFDYLFDRSWDDDPGNFTRLESIIRLIRWLKEYSAQDIYQMVAHANAHNYDHVWSGDFGRACDKINSVTREQILTKFG